MSKICTQCGVEKELDLFYVDRRQKTGRNSACISCIKPKLTAHYEKNKAKRCAQVRANYAANRDAKQVYSRAYQKKNSKKILAQRKDSGYDLEYKYGLSLAQYSSMLSAQSGVCKICGAPPEDCKPHGRLNVDHDHDTGKVRGLLCNRCNVALGGFRDSPALLLSAVKYLTP